MASVKDAPTNKQDALVAVLYKEYFEKVILPNFKPDYRSKIIHLHIRNIVKRALKTNPTLMVFIFSYQDSGKKRYLELFGENNSNLLSASYLQCPHCQLQLNIDRN